MTLAIWLAAALPAGASDYDVGNGRPYATVAAAVAQAAADPGDGHTVRIFDPGPFTETVVITEAMTVRGEGVVPVLHPIDEDDGFFTIVAPGADVSVQGVEIDGEGVHRAILVLAGRVAVTDTAIRNAATTHGPGGGIFLNGGPSDRLTVTGSTFTDCATLGVYDGGAIASAGGDLVVRGSTFEGGSARDDGAHLATIFGSGAGLVLEDSVLRHGVATDGGGALYVRDGVIEIRRTRFEGNVALDEGGGAFQAETVDSLLVEDSTFVDNEAFGSGGAIYQVDGEATYTRNLFCNNRSSHSGGAFFVDAGGAVLENSVFLWNSAVEDAGAARVDSALLTFTHNSLAANAAGALGRGQAVTAQSGPGAVIADSWFGYHGEGTEAVVSLPVGAASVATSAWWQNVGGDWNGQTIDLGTHVTADGRIAQPQAGRCEPLDLIPPADSPLRSAASDGGAIGAFGGPHTWPDGDADGWLSLQDCDDAVAGVFPGAEEVPADGVDQDCDGGDVCYADADGDGVGDGGVVTSDDLGCSDPGETADPGGAGVEEEPPAPSRPGGAPPEATPAGCGCATPGATGGWLAGLLLVARGRRSPRAR